MALPEKKDNHRHLQLDSLKVHTIHKEVENTCNKNSTISVHLMASAPSTKWGRSPTETMSLVHRMYDLS